MSISMGGGSIKQLRQKFAQSTGLPLRESLPAKDIEAAFKAENIPSRRCFFDPMVTTWAFLSQVLDSDRSCRKAISRIFAYFSDTQPVTAPVDWIDSPSDTGAYCKARQRLSLGALQRLYRTVATRQEEDAAPERRWCGRRVFLSDGTTVLMPDTQANQAVYPQHTNQQEGCGFPMAKLVTIFSLTTGALIEAITDVWSAYEPALLRKISTCLKPNDILVADAIYGAYVEIALLHHQLVDSVFCLHGSRQVDFRQGQKVGKKDGLFTWEKPKQCPQSLLVFRLNR